MATLTRAEVTGESLLLYRPAGTFAPAAGGRGTVGGVGGLAVVDLLLVASSQAASLGVAVRPAAELI